MKVGPLFSMNYLPSFLRRKRDKPAPFESDYPEHAGTISNPVIEKTKAFKDDDGSLERKYRQILRAIFEVFNKHAPRCFTILQTKSDITKSEDGSFSFHLYVQINDDTIDISLDVLMKDAMRIWPSMSVFQILNEAEKQGNELHYIFRYRKDDSEVAATSSESNKKRRIERASILIPDRVASLCAKSDPALLERWGPLMIAAEHVLIESYNGNFEIDIDQFDVVVEKKAAKEKKADEELKVVYFFTFRVLTKGTCIDLQKLWRAIQDVNSNYVTHIRYERCKGTFGFLVYT